VTQGGGGGGAPADGFAKCYTEGLGNRDQIFETSRLNTAGNEGMDVPQALYRGGEAVPHG
jgi:hypothetical protein